jgi:sulfonate transport system substrate-binding protein
MVRVSRCGTILEALKAGALDVGYTGDLSFLTVYAAGAPIKAIGGTRSDARTQAILVRQDSPIKTAADLKGKRLAGTRGGWGQFLIDATLRKRGTKSTTPHSHHLVRSMPR